MILVEEKTRKKYIRKKLNGARNDDDDDGVDVAKFNKEDNNFFRAMRRCEAAESEEISDMFLLRISF